MAPATFDPGSAPKSHDVGRLLVTDFPLDARYVSTFSGGDGDRIDRDGD